MAGMTQYRRFKAAYDMIGDKRRWTTDKLGETKGGETVSEFPSRPAVKWCFIGALYQKSTDDKVIDAFDKFCKARYRLGASLINDRRGWAAIRAAARAYMREKWGK